MEYKEFEKELVQKSEKISEKISVNQAENFYKYMLLLLEWNQKMNLTAITDEKEIIYKHFMYSTNSCIPCVQLPVLLYDISIILYRIYSIYVITL